MKISRPALEAALRFTERWLTYQYNDNRWPGFVVAIQHKNDLVFNKAFGFANIASNERMTASHVFRIASHSKTFTAVAVMQLFERGKLRLDDPLALHISWLQGHRDPRMQSVTIRQVLEHASGIIRDSFDANYWQFAYKFPDRAELKKRTLMNDLVMDANMRFKYSNLAYSLLGEVIEQASGLTYGQYLTKNIIGKLKLTNTHPEYSESVKPMATGYSPLFYNRDRTPLPQTATNAMAPATGLSSTAGDLCEYVSALFYGSVKLVSDASKRELLRLHWRVDDDEVNYGLGFNTWTAGERVVYGHGGGFPGFVSNTAFDPVDKIAVVTLSNFAMAPTRAINNTILTALDYFARAYKPGKRNLNKFEGEFYSIYGVNFIVDLGSKLASLDPNDWRPFAEANELSPMVKNRFKIEKADGYESPGEVVDFEFTTDGSVKRLNYAGYDQLRWDDYQKYVKSLSRIQHGS